MCEWRTGGGEEISFDDIVETIVNHHRNNGKISVGSDSFIKKDDCIFSTAICLYDADQQSGGRYFVKKNKLKKKSFPNLLQRVLTETQRSVELGVYLLKHVPTLDIEIHLDISGADKKKRTSKFAEMLTGYAKGAGFKYKIKPDAFAAQTVADKHSK